MLQSKPHVPTDARPARGRGSHVALLVLCALSLLLVTRDSAFLGDDLTLVEAGRHMLEQDMLRPFTQRWIWTEIAQDWPPSAIDFYRPLVVATFAIDYLVWGPHPLGYLITNALLHVACTLILFRLARRIYPPEAIAAPLLCGACFALNPGQMFNVLWISARTDTLCALFYFSALLGVHRASTSHSRTAALFAGLFAALAIASKEMAYTLPLLGFMIYAIAAPPSTNLRDWMRTAWSMLWPMTMVTALLLLLRLWVIDGDTQNPQMSVGLVQRIQTLFRELRSLVLPFDFPLKAAFVEHLALSTVVLLLLAGIAVCLAPRLRSRITLLSALWILVTLLPVLSVYNPWYLYIPCGGLALGLGWFFGAQTHGFRAVVGIVGAVVLLGLYGREINARSVAWNEAGRVVNAVAQDFEHLNTSATARPIFLAVPGEVDGIPVFNHNLDARLRLQIDHRGMEVSVAGYLAVSSNPAEHEVHIARLDANNWTVSTLSPGAHFIFPTYPQDTFVREWGRFEITEQDGRGLPTALRITLHKNDFQSYPIYYYSGGRLLSADTIPFSD